MNWPLLISFLLTTVIIIVFQFFYHRRRLRARVMQQLEMLARVELEKRLRERLRVSPGVAAAEATMVAGGPDSVAHQK